MKRLHYIAEPPLMFKHGQTLEDPRDGLTLFGPLEEGQPFGIRYGVIGTTEGIARLNKWVLRIGSPIFGEKDDVSRPAFPGFEAGFRCAWPPVPQAVVEVGHAELKEVAHLEEKHDRVFKTVDIFASRLLDATREDDATPNLWFVVIPRYVKENCRPQSTIVSAERTASHLMVGRKDALSAPETPFLFAEANAGAEVFRFEPNFHNQLKARLLARGIVTQIVLEDTLTLEPGASQRQELQWKNMESSVAWNLSTGTFYKVGGKPWKNAAVRNGVCYLGLVFKQDERSRDVRNACCAAQMFLDSGDGVVFKGAVGPWYNPTRGDYHLSHDAAKAIAELAVKSYAKSSDGRAPTDIFIHGRTRLNDTEWAGFLAGLPTGTRAHGVGIWTRGADSERIKLFASGKVPPLRGTALILDERNGYLWTKGFVPRLRTYPGFEVPNPVAVQVLRGDASIEQVLADVLALTKLNYNSCRFGDGVPVTLRFADAVGEILTAGPVEAVPPLPFRHYI